MKLITRAPTHHFIDGDGGGGVARQHVDLAVHHPAARDGGAQMRGQVRQVDPTVGGLFV